ncbi:MAG: molybdopterin-guanine dinucleotide biosynthesis protein B [Veillonellaceae bacterium]|nr:molybdopterin-guanine dinucleotide biosynthesis protein B [Veillonellaceae bacterium]
MIPIISFIGRSGVGKTTYLEKLIAELKKRGYRVGVVKHDIHGFEIDHPGKDTWRHAQAGADVVCISSHEKFALIQKMQRDLPLTEIVARIRDVDIILVEGYKNHSAIRAEIYRRDCGREPLGRPEGLFAVIADVSLYPELPHFDLNSVASFTDFLEQNFLEAKQ